MPKSINVNDVNNIDIQLKVSMFVWIKNQILTNDLLGKSYLINDEISEVLKYIENYSASIEDLLKNDHQHSIKKCLEFLLREQILVPGNKDETSIFYPRMIDIETVRHCNARCVYCPQSISSKPYKIMELPIYNKIVDRLQGYQPQWVTLNHYGEPLLDPHFKERVKLLSENNIELSFASNGVKLTKDLIDFFKNVKIHSMHFNFPSLDQQQWSKMMRLPEYRFYAAKGMIESILEEYSGKFDINVVVNSVVENRQQRARKIRNYFAQFGDVKIVMADTRSRCGTVINNHVSACEHTDELFGGCERIVNHLYISWEGKCFLCSDDYYQTNVLGNIIKDDIMTIMSAESVKRIKEEIFGLTNMRKDLIRRNCTKLRRRII